MLMNYSICSNYSNYSHVIHLYYKLMFINYTLYYTLHLNFAIRPILANIVDKVLESCPLTQNEETTPIKSF